MEKKTNFSGPRRPAGPRPRPGQKPTQRGGRSDKDPYATNEQIRAREVRLVGDNVEQGVYPIEKARRIARDMELDLIEISPTAEPPVCRILDYQKFLYQQKKRQKEQKAKATKVVVKEIRFGPQTDDHDYNFKLKHAQGFLKEGSKVKAYVFFRGRSILFKEQGEVLLLRFANDLEDLGKVEQMPVLEGKRMIIMISPLKTQPKKDSSKKDSPKPESKPAEATPEVSKDSNPSDE
ncbi:translation initiation factor IF-3 [bacterium]|nr:translation initiation factor IF-3 [Bacteroidales bacterium]MBD5292201.1 translation initiation factor IF-3 [Bacteroides sp.]MBD5338656.1 translation initiation factor IF-3 [Bacteroides sp.]MBD5386170.1 translation initiation factor IF-3 [bacterium]